MEKPTEHPLSTDGARDYDLSERVVRQLQDSHLHVFATHVASSLPDALKTGRPDIDDVTFISVMLTMLTDGRRGFLILVDELPQYDAAVEMTELVRELAPDAPDHAFVVRGACMSSQVPCERPRSLRLQDPARVRAEVERAYEEAFADRDAIDHAAFLSAFSAYNFRVHDERSLRAELYGEPLIAPAAAPEPVSRPRARGRRARGRAAGRGRARRRASPRRGRA